MENIKYAFETSDGAVHEINVSGARNLIDAVFELASSIMHGDLSVDPDEIVKFIDIAG